MSLSQTTNAYEILVRFNEADGSFQGAHEVTVTLVREGETTIARKQNDPASMTLSALQTRIAGLE